ncbi:sensor histidine kinase [Sphingomonas morindae]|uniref:Histidine kinase n=1 Tax=Sphingomonas morindae TaxID=1541170 RepID=A0ABY4X9T3_9SPHN|nr:histidine kinase [Sphingomonas morindae]USI73594.1 histidine kinase [Sphingomonas morindae]
MVALAYTPAVWLLNASAGWRTLLATLGAMILFFLPWALVTPAVLRASARQPLGAGRTLRSLIGIGGMGVILVPVVTALGLLLNEVAAWLIEGRRFLPLAQLAQGATITSFFSVPIYVAVIGVGQALLWIRQTGERERLRADARLEALRAQVNPHFLFNALTAIGELAHNDVDVAQAAIARLADVLRATLAVERPELMLAEEIAIAKDHIELYRLLLPGPLDFRVSASPAAWNAQVPALILQPLVENALVHALARVAQGRLCIAAEDHDGRLSLKIENSMPDSIAPSRGAGSGVANARERLTALYGIDATLATDVEGEQFVVTLDLPLVTMGNTTA